MMQESRENCQSNNLELRGHDPSVHGKELAFVGTWQFIQSDMRKDGAHGHRYRPVSRQDGESL